MNELDILKQRVQALLEWKAERERQQLTFPIDTQSEHILNEKVLATTGTEVVPGSLLVDTTALQVKVGDLTYYLLASPSP